MKSTMKKLAAAGVAGFFALVGIEVAYTQQAKADELQNSRHRFVGGINLPDKNELSSGGFLVLAYDNQKRPDENGYHAFVVNTDDTAYEVTLTGYPMSIMNGSLSFNFEVNGKPYHVVRNAGYGLSEGEGPPGACYLNGIEVKRVDGVRGGGERLDKIIKNAKEIPSAPTKSSLKKSGFNYQK